jgi:hypothetical protein
LPRSVLNSGALGFMLRSLPTSIQMTAGTSQ